MRKRIFTSVAIILTISIFSSPGQSQAATMMITSRAGLVSSDYFDWSGFGSNFTDVPSPSGPLFSHNGNLQVTATINQSNYSQVRLQGDLWLGNFAPGDYVLYTTEFGTGMVLNFNIPIMGAGAQLQPNYMGNFTARIEAFGSTGNSLGAFMLDGSSTSDADNSAMFLGIRSDSADIAKISYSIFFPGNRAFGVNRLDVASAIPEPAAMLLLGSGLVGFVAFGRKMNKIPHGSIPEKARMSRVIRWSCFFWLNTGNDARSSKLILREKKREMKILFPDNHLGD